MFANELALQEMFIQLKQKELNENEKLLSEFNARFGNVDIVKAIINDSHLMSSRQAQLLSKYQFAKVIGYLHKKAIRTFDYLVKRTGYTSELLTNLISQMIRTQIIEEVRPKRYTIANHFQFPNLEFISFEAKLTDWKKAILQAHINKKFSSYSYTVFPFDIASRLLKNNHHFFKMYNVGLIGVTKDRIHYLHRPNKVTIRRSINPSFISSIAKFQLESSQFANT